MNNVFFYDASFEGLLSAVFEAYVQKQFPDELLPEGAAPPLFAGRVFHVATQEEKTALLGQLLFAAAGLGEALGVESEEALTRRSDAFIAELADQEGKA